MRGLCRGVTAGAETDTKHNGHKNAPIRPQKATDGTSGHGDIEQNDNTSEQVSDGVLRPKCAKSVHPLPDDVDLRDLVERWPGLPEHIKAAIMALVKSQGEGQ